VHVAKDGRELELAAPEGGRIVAGTAASTTRLDLEIRQDSVQLDIAPGWNLLALPFAVSASPTGILKQDRAALCHETVWTWDSPRQRLVRVTDYFPAGAGFWAYGVVGQTEKTDAIVGLRTAGNALQLRAGWNLIGVREDSRIPSGIVAYGFVGGQYVQPAYLAAGRGYWVYSRRAITLELVPR
jgi:hypothetical protein